MIITQNKAIFFYIKEKNKSNDKYKNKIRKFFIIFIKTL